MEALEHFLSVRNALGEGPLWNGEEQALYWVDIEAGAYYRFHPSSGTLQHVEVGLPVGVLRLRQGGGMVLGTRDGFQFWDPGTYTLTPIANPEPGKKGSRINDGMIDPQGRFWAGSIADGMTSALYRLDANLSVHTMQKGIGISNGLGWSLDGRSFYYTDSRTGEIYAYDFDPATGEIENRRVLVKVPASEGTPDGMAIDAEGFIWSAQWGGWKINRYDPAGKLERQISLPVEFPTSCAFGGKDLDELYITSAWVALGEAKKDTQPQAGDIFRLRPGVRGLPERKFAG